MLLENIQLHNEPHDKMESSVHEGADKYRYKCKGVKKHQCNFCIKVFGQKTTLKKHIERKHTKNYKCATCGEGFVSTKKLYKHNTLGTIHKLRHQKSRFLYNSPVFI